MSTYSKVLAAAVCVMLGVAPVFADQAQAKKQQGNFAGPRPTASATSTTATPGAAPATQNNTHDKKAHKKSAHHAKKHHPNNKPVSDATAKSKSTTSSSTTKTHSK